MHVAIIIGDWCEELLSGLSLEAIASQTDPVRQLLGSALAAVAPGNDGSGGEGLVVLQTEEWLQRKMVHRVTTPELMFGVMVAPPPVSMTTDAVTAGDILSCFSEAGSPTAGELSPIAMVRLRHSSLSRTTLVMTCLSVIREIPPQLLECTFQVSVIASR